MKDQVYRNLDQLVVPVICEISFVNNQFGAGIYNKKTTSLTQRGKKHILVSESIDRGLVY